MIGGGDSCCRCGCKGEEEEDSEEEFALEAVVVVVVDLLEDVADGSDEDDNNNDAVVVVVVVVIVVVVVSVAFAASGGGGSRCGVDSEFACGGGSSSSEVVDTIGFFVVSFVFNLGGIVSTVLVGATSTFCTYNIPSVKNRSSGCASDGGGGYWLTISSFCFSVADFFRALL